MNWLLDFDDTLAVGPVTWALQHVFPDMIKTNNLPYDEALYTQVMLKAQRQGNEGVDEETILDEMFARFGWPDHLKAELGQKVYYGYELALFDDTIPFLDHLRERGDRVFVISNNDKAAEHAGTLGIAGYFTGIYYPERCGGVPAKPQRDMWAFVTDQYPELKDEPATFVGDDPWSDGLFAEHCQLPCWIVDRMQRYHTLYAGKPYQWAASLRDLMR